MEKKRVEDIYQAKFDKIIDRESIRLAEQSLHQGF